MKKWSTIKTEGERPSPRFLCAHSMVNKNLFLFGGYTQEKATNSVFKLDMGILTNVFCRHSFILEKLTWKKAEHDMPLGRCGASATSFGNKVYVFGGLARSTDGCHALSNEFYEYNTTTENWKILTSNFGPSPRADSGICNWSNSVFIFGGCNSLRHPLKDAYEFNTIQGEWDNKRSAQTLPKVHIRTQL